MATESRKTDYVLESDEEISRLSNQHDVIKDAMGSLVLAPIDLHSSPLRVLDSATADGTWIRDLAASTAPIAHHFTGIDLDASNFPANQSHQTYLVQDITKPWPDEWKQSFDFVHQRLALVAGGKQQQQILGNLLALVKPGGWVQLIEATNELSDDAGPAMRNFVAIMKGLFTALGCSMKLADELPAWLEEAGFVDIQDRLVPIKLGATNPDPGLAKQGVFSTTVAAGGLANFGKTLPQGTISLSADQIENMPGDLEAELARDGAIYPLRVVWGRKPPIL